MQVKEAVKVAKAYLSDVFEDEQIRHLALEEVRFDERDKLWSVTLGFNRRWKSPKPGELGAALGKAFGTTSYSHVGRDYKVVKIRDDDGIPISIVNYETMN